MRKLSVFLMSLLFGGLVALAPEREAAAQEPNAGVIFYQFRQFKIPFKNDQKSANVTKVHLFVSRDQGQTWQWSATAVPEDQYFSFNTTQDGLHWFAVQTLDRSGKLYPPQLQELKTNLRVIVDTVPPRVQVSPLTARNGEVGVSWTVSDDNLDLTLPDAVQLQYRLQGGVNWTALVVSPGSTQHFWNPRTNGGVEVRVLARDRAGNVGEDKTVVSLGGSTPPNPTTVGTNPNENSKLAKELQRRYVNNKQISLRYDLEGVGKSGVSKVELWYTLYKSRSWNKLTEYPVEVKNPAELDQPKKLTFDVEEEGIYGITLLAKSGVGIGEQAPRTDDPPQLWIEVDLTKPVVQILNTIVGTGLDKGKLTILWSAQDKNLGPAPIRISYSEQKDGPWNTLADKLPNTHRYVWSMPEQLPYQFYMRVEAVDLAGNVGEAATQDKVKVDLSVPKARPRDIEPGGK